MIKETKSGIERFYMKPNEVAELLERLNPKGKFWVEGSWVLTDMNLQKIRLLPNMEIRTHGGKNFLKRRINGFLCQETDIINPKGRNLYNRY